MSKKRKIAYLAAVGNALIWGAALPLVKPSLSHITPYQFLFLRFLVAAPLLFPFLIKGILKQKRLVKALPKIVLIEVLSMTVLFIIYLGLEKTSALQASFFLNTKPIFTTLAGILILKEVEERNELIGLIFSVIGTALVISTPLFFGKQLADSEFSLFGNGLIFSALLLDVIRLIYVNKIYDKQDKLNVVSISTLIGLIYFALVSSLTGDFPSLSVLQIPSVLIPVLYMGTLGTIVAFTLQYVAYTQIETSEASLFSYLQPLVYIPLSVIWLKETLLPTQLIGIIIIAFGVFIAERRIKKKRA
ncbi:DMT family transporter [Patescibacteria group bacterium]